MADLSDRLYSPHPMELKDYKTGADYAIQFNLDLETPGEKNRKLYDIMVGSEGKTILENQTFQQIEEEFKNYYKVICFLIPEEKAFRDEHGKLRAELPPIPFQNTIKNELQISRKEDEQVISTKMYNAECYINFDNKGELGKSGLSCLIEFYLYPRNPDNN
jgi:hypothetical protein